MFQFFEEVKEDGPPVFYAEETCKSKRLIALSRSH